MLDFVPITTHYSKLVVEVQVYMLLEVVFGC